MSSIENRIRKLEEKVTETKPTAGIYEFLDGEVRLWKVCGEYIGGSEESVRKWAEKKFSDQYTLIEVDLDSFKDGIIMIPPVDPDAEAKYE